MPTADVWTESFPVRSYHVGPHGTASVLALCDVFQDAAGHHAAALGVSMQALLDDNKAWVLAHLQMQVDRLPEWGETVTIETWPSGLERLYATREFVVCTAAGARLAAGTSAWLVIDTERRRPVRPPRALFTLETPNRPAPLPLDVSDVPKPERTDHERTFGVRYHDLDLNRHVNNVRYLEWAAETLPSAIHETHRCAEVALQFRAETTLGDTVRAVAQVDTGADDDRYARHALHVGDRPVAHATTRWRRRD